MIAMTRASVMNDRKASIPISAIDGIANQDICRHRATHVTNQIDGAVAVQDVTLSGLNLPVIANEPFFTEKTLTKDRYPEGFEGRRICRMCCLQSWSWKPALNL
jgi:hypothetical protein